LNTQFETWLHDKFGAHTAGGQPASPSLLRIGPPLAGWEDEFLMRGLSENLFEIDDRGSVASELLGGEPARSYRLFSTEPVRLLRENICQLATASRLVFERGWLPRHVTLEPGRDEHHSTAGQFDLLVRSSAGDILIWIEVKRTGVELNKLVADLHSFSRRGPHAHADCGFPQNHPRHQFCVATQPSYLWAVAPDGDAAFEVSCNAHSVDLDPLPSLPPRSLLELG
jgi:hypothetical protein